MGLVYERVLTHIRCDMCKNHTFTTAEWDIRKTDIPDADECGGIQIVGYLCESCVEVVINLPAKREAFMDNTSENIVAAKSTTYPVLVSDRLRVINKNKHQSKFLRNPANAIIEYAKKAGLKESGIKKLDKSLSELDITVGEFLSTFSPAEATANISGLKNSGVVLNLKKILKKEFNIDWPVHENDIHPSLRYIEKTKTLLLLVEKYIDGNKFSKSKSFGEKRIDELGGLNKAKDHMRTFQSKLENNVHSQVVEYKRKRQTA